MKSKKIIVIIIALIIIIGVTYLIIVNPIVSYNNRQLQRAITSVLTNSVEINKVVPFDWDVVYTFEPYASKEQIEQIIGFKSLDIQENQINEGMVHLLFVRDKKVVASVLDYAENLGYILDFSEKLNFADSAIFDVTHTDGIIVLSYVK